MSRAWLLVVLLGLAVIPDATAQPTPQGQEAIPMADPLGIRLAELTAALVTTAEPLTPVTIMVIPTEGTSVYPADVGVEEGRCYTFAAVGDETATDIDLHVYGRGVEVVANTGLDNTPMVHWCNEVFTEVSVEIRMFRGSGRFAFQVFRDLAPPAGSDTTIDGHLYALAGRVAQGYMPAAQPYRGVLATQAEENLDLTLAGGRCYVLVGVGGSTVLDLDLQFLSADGQVVDQDQLADAEPVVRPPCLAEGAGGQYRVIVRMVEGYGEFALGVFSL